MRRLPMPRCSRGAVVLVAVALLVATVPSPASAARWRRSGPEGGDVIDLVIDPRAPSTLYALTASGVLRTTDGGAHWIEPGYFFEYFHHIALDADASTLYGADAGGFGIAYSTEGVAFWQTSLAVAHLMTTAIAADPARPGTVLAGTDTGRVYRSADAGKTWQSTDAGGGVVHALVVDAAAPNTVYAATGHGIFLSTDGGAGWSDAGTGLGDQDVVALAQAPGAPATLYAATVSGMFASMDGAATWLPTPSPGIVRALAVDPRASRTVYAGTTDGLAASRDGGITWRRVDVGPGVRGVAKIVFDPATPGVVYCATDGAGVARSDDGGATWRLVDTGLRRHSVSAVAADPRDPATLWMSTWSGGVFRSVDGGATFVARNGALPDGDVVDVVVDPFEPERTWIVMETAGIFASMDDGATWTANAPAVSYRRAIVPAPVPGMFYATDDVAGVTRTTDGGVTWTPTAPGPPWSGALAVGSPDGSLVYVATFSGLYRSADGGASWTVKLPGSQVTAVALAPLHPATVYAGTFGNDGQLYRSTDGGETWLRLRSFQDVGSIVVDPRDPQVVFAANGWSVGGSVDGGSTWDVVGDNTVSLNGLIGLSIPRPGLLCAGARSAGAFMIDYGPAPDPTDPGPPACHAMAPRTRHALARAQRTAARACPAPSRRALVARARRDLRILCREQRTQAASCTGSLRPAIAPLRRWIARCRFELPIASRRR